ncbi:hypothetical protein BAY59_12065 [Prauserella coralliicola]|nr:hypothetical protein BAY59_12065 [Prauserella coralliicola]
MTSLVRGPSTIAPAPSRVASRLGAEIADREGPPSGLDPLADEQPAVDCADHAVREAGARVPVAMPQRG